MFIFQLFSTHSNKASWPPEQKNFCSIRWYGYFLSSNSMGEVKPTEQIKKVSLIMKEKHINISLIHLQEIQVSGFREVCLHWTNSSSIY